MKKPQKSRSISGKSVLLCIKAWSKRSLGLWGMLVFVMLCGCRSPQSPVTKRGAEPNRPYARQQSALSADSSKPTSAQATPSHAKTSASDATTQRPAVPLLQPTQPTQTQATRTIVAGGSPTSRPIAKFETLLTWQSFVGNAKIDRVQVFGEDRPRAALIRYETSKKGYTFFREKLLYLDAQCKVRKNIDIPYQVMMEPNGMAALTYALYSVADYIKKEKTLLLDGEGNIRWQAESIWGLTSGKFFATKDGKKFLMILPLQTNEMRLYYFVWYDTMERKGRRMPQDFPFGQAREVDASPKRTEFAYIREGVWSL